MTVCPISLPHCFCTAMSLRFSRYMFDEPSSYLDVKQRLNAAAAIRSLLRAEKYVIVVEHDLAVLDYLSDFICCLYGVPGAYGVVTMPFSVREGQYLSHTQPPALLPFPSHLPHLSPSLPLPPPFSPSLHLSPLSLAPPQLLTHSLTYHFRYQHIHGRLRADREPEIP